MQLFNLYFTLGIEHIITWEALDHILFVMALCLRYTWKDWKKIAILVTAFTIGHSLTLLLCSMNYVRVPTGWIEFFIPLTIVATAVNTLLYKPSPKQEKLPVIYFFALFFGLIHGMAYATTLIDLEGGEGLLLSIFAFNTGIEVGQLLVVAVVLLISYILAEGIKIPHRRWVIIASIVILFISVKMTVERLPALLS